MKVSILLLSVLGVANAQNYIVRENRECQTGGPYAFINVESANIACSDSSSEKNTDCRRWLITTDTNDCVALCDAANQKEDGACTGFNYVKTGVHSNGLNKDNGVGTCYFRKSDSEGNNIIRDTIAKNKARDCYIRRGKRLCKSTRRVETKCEQWTWKLNNGNDGYPVSGPIPDEDRGAVHIDCGDGEVVLISAMYGRNLGYDSLCPYYEKPVPSAFATETACENMYYKSAPASGDRDIQALQDAYCDGGICDIPATNVAHTDPCVGIYKYLQVEYKCKVTI